MFINLMMAMIMMIMMVMIREGSAFDITTIIRRIW